MGGRTLNGAVTACFWVIDDIDANAVTDHFGFFGAHEFACAVDAAQAVVASIAAGAAVGCVTLEIDATAPAQGLSGIFAGHG